MVFFVKGLKKWSNKSLAISQFVLSNKIDICAITETWLTQSSPASLLNELNPPGYEFIHHPRAKRRGGGAWNYFQRLHKH